MNGFGGNAAMAPAANAGFYQDMAKRRMPQNRPQGNAVGGGLGPAPTPPQAPPVRPPSGNVAQPPSMPPSMPLPNAPGGNAMPNFGGNMGGGPMENLFFSLPQGTEEAFGAAPAGFNRTLMGGGKLPGMPNYGRR